MINVPQLNASLRALGAHDRYAAGAVAWNDGRRGIVVVDGKPVLSSYGANITDCCIVTEDGGTCQYIKPSNMDETLGIMDAKDILMVDGDGRNISVQGLLDDLETRTKYMGYTSVKANASRNERVVVRFQTAWVPIQRGTSATKIVPQHYSYQTRSRTNPRNLIALGTPQGVFVHNDDAGGNRLFAHSVDKSGTITTHWFQAESNKECMVGHAARVEDHGAVEMGIRGMGHRTNCFVTVAIPNRQGMDVDDDDFEMPVYRSLTCNSYAARVSVSEDSAGSCDANAIDIERPVGEPIVVTVLTYNTTEVPDDFYKDPTSMQIATTDIALGVVDLDRQYELVKKNGGVVCKLSELPEMLHTLTEKHVEEIAEKIMEDPPLFAN